MLIYFIMKGGLSHVGSSGCFGYSVLAGRYCSSHTIPAGRCLYPNPLWFRWPDLFGAGPPVLGQVIPQLFCWGLFLATRGRGNILIFEKKGHPINIDEVPTSLIKIFIFSNFQFSLLSSLIILHI